MTTKKTYIPTNPIHYNTRKYFRENIIDTLPNDEKVWATVYRSWLAEQGCKIVISKKNWYTHLISDVLDVTPGYHEFEFDKEEDALIFVLKWS